VKREKHWKKKQETPFETFDRRSRYVGFFGAILAITCETLKLQVRHCRKDFVAAHLVKS